MWNVVLLESEHLNVPSFIELAVEFNLLKSTTEQHYMKLPSPPSSPSQSRYIITSNGDLGVGVVYFHNKYGSVLHWSIRY